MTNNISELRARVQTATGGSRGLDAEVYWLITPSHLKLAGNSYRYINSLGTVLNPVWDSWLGSDAPAFTSRPNDPSAAMEELRRRGWKLESISLDLKTRKFYSAIAATPGRYTHIVRDGQGKSFACAATDALLAVVESEKGDG